MCRPGRLQGCVAQLVQSRESDAIGRKSISDQGYAHPLSGGGVVEHSE
jgi:hypothetical protein